MRYTVKLILHPYLTASGFAGFTYKYNYTDFEPLPPPSLLSLFPPRVLLSICVSPALCRDECDAWLKALRHITHPANFSSHIMTQRYITYVYTLSPTQTNATSLCMWCVL